MLAKLIQQQCEAYLVLVSRGGSHFSTKINGATFACNFKEQSKRRAPIYQQSVTQQKMLYKKERINK